MGRACVKYGREERCILGLVVRPKGESPLERKDLGVDWRIILKWILKK